MNYIFDYLRSFKQALEEGIFIKEDVSLVSSKENLARKVFSKRQVNIIKSIYIFFRGNNFFIDSRRNLIRKLLLKYCDSPIKSIRKVVNYMIDENDFDKIEYALCFGIYDDIAFENQISKTYDVPVFAADPTEISIKTMLNYNKKENFTYMPVALDINNEYKRFYNTLGNDTESNIKSGSLQNINNNEDYIEVECINLEKIMDILNLENLGNTLLKMDIEGGALPVLEDLLKPGKDKSSLLPKQIAVEIEVPKVDSKAMFEIVNRADTLLSKLSEFYKIYNIPRLKRYKNIEVLLVRNN